MTAIRIIAALGAAALLALGAIACGDDDDDGDNGEATVARTTGPTRPATSPTAGTTAAATSAATAATTGTAGAGETLTVTAADNRFSPTSLQAAIGEPVTIELDNTGSNPHTLTVYEDAGYTTEVAGADTGQVSGGDTGDFTATFDEAKTYSFRCENHPSQMEGTITVQ